MQFPAIYYTLIVLKTLRDWLALAIIEEERKRKTHPKPDPPVAIMVPGIWGCQCASLICSM